MRRADRSKLQGKFYTSLELKYDQPGPTKRTATLGQLELVPPLGHNLLSATLAIKASDNLVIIKKNEARMDSGESAYRFVLKNRMYAADSKHSVSNALGITVAETRYIIEYHRFLGHTNDQQTRATAKTLGTVLTDTWQPCVRCSMAKARRVAVLNTSRVRSKGKVGRLFIDLSGPKSEKSLTSSDPLGL